MPSGSVITKSPPVVMLTEATFISSGAFAAGACNTTPTDPAGADRVAPPKAASMSSAIISPPSMIFPVVAVNFTASPAVLLVINPLTMTSVFARTVILPEPALMREPSVCVNVPLFAVAETLPLVEVTFPVAANVTSLVAVTLTLPVAVVIVALTSTSAVAPEADKLTLPAPEAVTAPFTVMVPSFAPAVVDREIPVTAALDNVLEESSVISTKSPVTVSEPKFVVSPTLLPKVMSCVPAFSVALPVTVKLVAG
ncbi:hypothetical protein Rcae01_06768 [Novipirellula caenicola]|uniref:Uncharacterized protein n=1 Tax=Novipirellula caenicola TaxID=1536901 RepID=A0ABP9W534_9BACT